MADDAEALEGELNQWMRSVASDMRREVENKNDYPPIPLDYHKRLPGGDMVVITDTQVFIRQQPSGVWVELAPLSSERRTV